MKYTIKTGVCFSESVECFKLTETKENDRSSAETSCLPALKNRRMNRMSAGEPDELWICILFYNLQY